LGRARLALGIVLGLTALVAVAVGGTWWLRGRQTHLDMRTRLASLAEREGIWDNQWNKNKEKQEDLRRLLAGERDPRKRLSTREMRTPPSPPSSSYGASSEASCPTTRTRQSRQTSPSLICVAVRSRTAPSTTPLTRASSPSGTGASTPCSAAPPER
jgi:hypothetical protein